DPCHCGSGKKYKKCCLAKDEEQARQAASAAAPPLGSNPAPFSLSTSRPGQQAAAPEPEASKERWAAFETADWEGRAAIFRVALAEVLEPFARSPGRFADQFPQLIRLLMYHGQTGPLLPAMRQAWPVIERSRQLMGWAIDEFAEILSALTIFDYMESATSPSP